MSTSPYLEAAAAALGDRELSPRLGRPVPITDSILCELEYLSDLSQRASKHVGDSLARLAAAGVTLAPGGFQGVTWDLLEVAVTAHIAALKSKEARANGL
jgi:hypothetical protein